MKRYFIFLGIIMFSFMFNLFGQPKSSVKSPAWSYNLNIYEVNLRQFTPSGTIKEFRTHLPRLKEMGVGILWFMPIHPIGEKNRKGTLGSYYSVKDYFAVDPAYGTMDEFKALVKEIQSMGMYVILDWVANHTAWDHPLTITNPEFFTRDSLGNKMPPVPDWSDVVDLNFDKKEVWKYMYNALEFWVREVNVDGYRCDVAAMVPFEFWDEARKRLDKIKPVFMLAEAEEPKHHIKAFDMSYSWEMHHLWAKIYREEKKASDIVAELKKEKKKFPKNSFRMRFTTNHDENSWNGTEFEKFGDGAKTFAVVGATIPGMFLIYTGQESANKKRLDFFEKDAVKWGNFVSQDFYSRLNSLKKENKALWNGEKGGEFINVNNSSPDKILSFIRKKDNNKILVIANLSKEKKDVSFQDKNYSGTYTDAFSGEKINLTKEESLQLTPWSYKVLISR